MHRVLAAAGLLLLASCASAEDERPASWSYIVGAILRPSCATASCHSERAARSGIELEEPRRAYSFMLGEAGLGDYVVPGDPAASKLIYLLRGQDIARMPPDLPLPEADIALIERWILEGAKEN